MSFKYVKKKKVKKIIWGNNFKNRFLIKANLIENVILGPQDNFCKNRGNVHNLWHSNRE